MITQNSGYNLCQVLDQDTTNRIAGMRLFGVCLEDQRDAVLGSLYLFYCQVTLHVSGVSRTHHQEYTNCSYNHWHRS